MSLPFFSTPKIFLSPGLEFDYIGNSVSNNPTFTVPLSTADRRIFVMQHWIYNGGGTQQLEEMEIGGVTATIHGQTGHSGGSTGVGAAIASALVPTGTSIQVAYDHEATVSERTAVFYANRLTSLTPHDSFINDASFSDDIQGTISVPAKGLLIMGGTGSSHSGNNIETFFFNGVDYDEPPGLNYEGNCAQLFTSDGFRNGTAAGIIIPTPQAITDAELDLLVFGESSNMGVCLTAISWA